MSTVASVVNLVRPTNVASLSQWATTFPNKIAQSNLGTNHVATPLVANPCTATARSRSNVFANVHARVIHDFLGQTRSPSQTAGQSVQPFLHSRWRILLHATLFCPIPPFKHTVPWVQPTQHPKHISIASAVFPQYTLVTDGRTDRPIDRTTTTELDVWVGRLRFISK